MNTIAPTTLSLSGERFLARYDFADAVTEAEHRARALCVEQTIEFPADLVPDDDISASVIGQIESVTPMIPGTRTRVTVSYAVETAGGELPQLLNVLFGNSSLLPGIRLVDIELPTSITDSLPGPAFGIAGVRQLCDAPSRPLLVTALKPMGLNPDRLAEAAYQLAAGGMDMIKDDHGLANQNFAPFRERVQRCSEAVQRANADTGQRAVYMPSINAPYDQLNERVETALDAGAGGLLVLPGLTGYDHMRVLAATSGVPVMAHPALLGSLTVAPDAGMAHSVVYGTLARLAGADLSVYPNFGGRFSFSPEECHSIAEALRRPEGAFAPAFPAPGGGMTLARVGEIVEFYGPDVALLIGGDLFRGSDLRATAEEFRATAESVTA